MHHKCSDLHPNQRGVVGNKYQGFSSAGCKYVNNTSFPEIQKKKYSVTLLFQFKTPSLKLVLLLHFFYLS